MFENFKHWIDYSYGQRYILFEVEATAALE
ncbi:hypothetical protein ABIB30_000258 [Pedobacter sp. UYP1]